MSYGKDSSCSFFLAKKNKINVVCLIVVISENFDSFMFQKCGIDLIEKDDYFGLETIYIKTKGDREIEVLDLENGLSEIKKKFKLDCIIVGAIKSTYQSLRFQKICYNLGLNLFNPLWQIDENKYLDFLLKNKFEILIVKIASYPFTKDLVGKLIDSSIKKKLIEYNKKYKTSLVGEGGEFETICINSPIHKKKFKLKKSEIICENENLCYLKLVSILNSKK